MSDPLPEDSKGPALSESDARVPSVQGNDEPGFSTPSQEQLIMEALARQALRAASSLGETSAENPSAASPRFKLENGGRGGRNAMAETAGRIGAAVGTAEREVRRRLELVRRPAAPIEFPSAVAAAEELAEHGARMMKEIDTEVTDLRRHAARKLEDWSEQAEERFVQFRREARTMFRRSSMRAQEIAETYPLQTIAAIAGTFFVVGAALRLSRRRRRG